MQPPPATLILLLLAALLTAGAAPGTSPTTKPATAPASPQSAEHTERLLATVARADELLAADPGRVDALQARAEANFRLGRIDASVRDFDKVVELEPAAMPHNWQRGIALYYAGRFADGAKQFERHREVNPQDVENAAFHYICLARSIGKEKGPAEAAKQLIPIERDPRVPLMKVHELYANRATPEDVIAEAKKGDPVPAELRERLFYGHLYIALWHDGSGRPDEAARHIKLAANDYAVPGYMGDVARVHAWMVATARWPAKK